jgi:uncharacterized protein
VPVREYAGRVQNPLHVIDNPQQHRYEAWRGDDVIGFIDYRLRPGLITLLHTEVDQDAEGHGVGSRLVADALDDIRGRGLAVLVVCPFVRDYIQRHPEHADLVASR